MFRFTIRDLIWLTALAALAVSWTLDHRSAAARAKKEHLAAKVQQREMQSSIHAWQEKFIAVEQQLRAKLEEIEKQP